MNSQYDLYRDGDIETPSCTESGLALPRDVRVSCETWPDGEPLVVTIVSGESSDGLLSNGGEFKVEPLSESDVLPPVMKCDVRTTDGETLQTLLISTEDPLYLKEQYGAFLVESCDDQICIQQIEFTYYVTNTGDREFSVTELIRDNDLAENPVEDIAENLDFPDGQDIRNILFADQTVSVTETYTLDICQPARISLLANLTAVGDGGGCNNSDLFNQILQTPTCVVEVDVECTYETQTGSEESCSTLVSRRSSGSPPPGACSCGPDDCARSMSFDLTGEMCTTDARFSCTDFMMSPSQEEVHVMIFGGDGDIYYNDTAKIGNTVTIESTSCLNETLINMITADQSFGMVYQSATVLHNCSLPTGAIELGTPYGGLTFRGYTCSDGTGPTPEPSCFQDITYTACGRNRGLVPTDISGLSLEIDGTVESILDENTVPLPTGGVYCASQTVEINLCSEVRFETYASITAGQAPETCQAIKKFGFEPQPGTSPPTPAPTSRVTTRPSPTPPPTSRTTTITKPPVPSKGKGKGKQKTQNIVSRRSLKVALDAMGMHFFKGTNYFFVARKTGKGGKGKGTYSKGGKGKGIYSKGKGAIAVRKGKGGKGGKGMFKKKKSSSSKGAVAVRKGKGGKGGKGMSKKKKSVYQVRTVVNKGKGGKGGKGMSKKKKSVYQARTVVNKGKGGKGGKGMSKKKSKKSSKKRKKRFLLSDFISGA